MLYTFAYSSTSLPGSDCSPQVEESSRNRDGQGYDTTYNFFGVFCKETGDCIYDFCGSITRPDCGGEYASGPESVQIDKPSGASLSDMRKQAMTAPNSYFTLLPADIKRTLIRYVRATSPLVLSLYHFSPAKEPMGICLRLSLVVL